MIADVGVRPVLGQCAVVRLLGVFHGYGTRKAIAASLDDE
jgi:hypothetical protein